ncbi:MAG: DapH/DapD/GlmU-related protein, partial [Rickettsiales bacterium]
STLWSGNHIGHHTRIGANVFIASHAVVSGAVAIGDNCFIGVNSTIRDNINLGARCVVGAGALVLSDAPTGTVFPGTATIPSRVPSDRLRSI